MFWHQISKQLWVREGDQNTKFFHFSVRNRRTLNRIESLKKEHGQLVDWNSGLENVMTDYFSKLFTASNTNWNEVLTCIDGKVTELQNNKMLAPVKD